MTNGVTIREKEDWADWYVVDRGAYILVGKLVEATQAGETKTTHVLSPYFVKTSSLIGSPPNIADVNRFATGENAAMPVTPWDSVAPLGSHPNRSFYVGQIEDTEKKARAQRAGVVLPGRS